MEIEIVKAFQWSLYDIDRTDIESMIPFLMRLAGSDGAMAGSRAYCDEVSWL